MGLERICNEFTPRCDEGYAGARAQSVEHGISTPSYFTARKLKG